ncbi:MAG: hypothetical protein KBI01_09015 [Oscillospiraceae bacterium]|nr:hypothetical protein [Oscillospiraceae bacterium]
MQMDFLWTLLISLALTLVLELVFSLAFKVRSTHSLTMVLLANVLTNPPVVLLNNILSRKTELTSVIIILILEIAAVLIEGIYYNRFANEIKRPFMFSLGANAFSYLTGLILQQLI